MAVVVVFDTPVDKGQTWTMPLFLKRGTIALGTYVTGGVTVTKANVGLAVSLDDLDVRPTGGYVASWDRTNAKVLVYQQSAATSALTEVPNSTDLSGTAFRFRATGK